MTARGPFAIAALAFHATLLPASALAQANFVPPAAAAAVPSSPLLSRHTAMLAGLVLGAAIWGDGEFREEAQEFRSGTTNSLATMGNTLGEWRYVIPAISAGYLAGELAGSSDLKRVMVHTGAAALLATGVSSALKYSIGRNRPPVAGDQLSFRPFSGANSFPSGHTTVAFAIATALADETDDGWSDFLFYGAATGTALARVNDDRHWTSDVIVGALVGHLSARFVTRRMGPVKVSPAGVTVNLQF